MATEPSRHVKLKKIIGIDLMGSDNAPSALLDAICSITPSLPSYAELAFIGAPEYAEKASPLRFYPASQTIGMEENPLHALRLKKQSSISVGIRLLKQGAIDALVSAGSTGALVSSAKMTLGAFPSLRRPALLALMPTKKTPLAVLDVGANLREKAPLLVQFAYLGAAYQQIRGIDKPRVGLLNIGSEPAKGTSEIRLAYQYLNQLKTPPFYFEGNVEGKSIFEGNIDVLVADGFTGNVFLKTSEGIASFILDQINARLSGKLKERLEHIEYPGALLAGVKGTVVKCHGSATQANFIQAIRSAIELASADFVNKLQNQWMVQAAIPK